MTHLVVFTTSNIIIYRENIKIRIFLVFLQEFSALLQPLSVRLSTFLPKIEIYQNFCTACLFWNDLADSFAV